MSYFKRFTDFCAGFTAFHAIIYLLGQFMSFNPAGDPSMTEKIKLFLAKDHPKFHREYVVLIILLIASAIIGRIFENMPYVSMAVSILPLVKIIVMFVGDKLYDRPMLYVLLAMLHVSGNVIHAVSLDRADQKRRAVICTDLFGISLFALAFWLRERTADLLALPDLAAAELEATDKSILTSAEIGVDAVIMRVGIFILISVAISLILRDVYFIDAILALFPLAMTLPLLRADGATLLAATSLCLTSFYLVFRIILLSFEPMAKGKISLPFKKRS